MKTRWLRNIFAFVIISLVSGGCLLSSWNTFGELDQALDVPPAATQIPFAQHPETQLDIHTLLQDQASNCRLPCFNGLIPGASTEKELEGFLQRFLFSNKSAYTSYPKPDGYYGVSLYLEPEGRLGIDFKLEEQILSLTHISLTKPDKWSSQIPFDLPIILEQLGTPDDVFVQFGGPPLFFYIYILYREQGIMFRHYAIYQDPEVVDRDTPLLVCLRNDIVDLQTVDVWLQSPLHKTSIEEQLPHLRDNDFDIRPIWAIERMTGESVDDFKNFFLKDSHGCFPTKSASQLREMGYQF